MTLFKLMVYGLGFAVSTFKLSKASSLLLLSLAQIYISYTSLVDMNCLPLSVRTSLMAHYLLMASLII